MKGLFFVLTLLTISLLGTSSIIIQIWDTLNEQANIQH